MKQGIMMVFLLILLGFGSAYGQDDSIYSLNINSEKAAEKELLMLPAERLNYKLFNGLIFPYQFNETCNAIFTMIVLPVRNNKLCDSLVFEEKCPEAVRATFKRVMPILREQRWQTIFPEVKEEKNYDVLLPFAFSFQIAGCWDTIPAKTIQWKTEQAVNRRNNNQLKSYCLPPLKISRFK